MTTELTQRQIARRKNLESEIRRGGAMVIDGLRAIHNEKLYLSTHDTWEAYCSRVWGMSQRHANRLIEHGRILELLTDETGPIGPVETAKPSGKSKKTAPKSAPKITEAATREVADLPDKQKVEVLTEAVATAPDGKPTAKHVKETRRKITGGTAFNPEEYGEPSIVRDKIERPIPAHLADCHELSAVLITAGNKLDPVKREVAALQAKPGGEFLPVQHIEQLLKEVKGLIQQSRYYTECPKCRGKVARDCKRCDGNGFLPFSRKGILSTEEKTWLGVE